jgi:soluble lytic murein transglycosylase-like protein
MRLGLGMLIFLVLATPLPGLAGQPAGGPRLPGLRHVFATVSRDLETVSGEAEAAARREAFERLANAVVGRPEQQPLVYEDVRAAFVADTPFPVPADAEAPARDRTVLVMAMSGYRLDRITDVVTGRLTLRVVEQATRLRLLGHSDAEIARYLEAHAAARAAGPLPVTAALGSSPTSTASALPAVRVDRGGRERFDRAVVHYARRHDVDPDLVRAVIRHESAWNSAARSRKGAIGLMQLMPDTARLLGVDPFDPEQNIAGGIRYLADLLTLWSGNLDAALVAYVAGPTYAQRWARGKARLDDEVRTYLKNVKASYRRQSGGRTD